MLATLCSLSVWDKSHCLGYLTLFTSVTKYQCSFVLCKFCIQCLRNSPLLKIMVKVSGLADDSDDLNFSVSSGGFDQISSLLLKAEESTSQKEDPDDEDGNVVKQNRCIAPIYKEFPILKEEFVPNHMTVSVRSSDKTDKNIVQFDTDLPGDVVIHWGVCKDDGRKWVIPSTPHPPATKIFRHKALQTLLQVK